MSRYPHISKLLCLAGLCGFFVACTTSRRAITTAAPHVDAAKPVEVYDVVEGLNLGNKAPDIELNNPAGSLVKLSSLRGHVVLIDFWASWCGPCRRENPTVVQAAKTYQDTHFKNGTGFRIYSVSLDNSKDAWVKAIQKDSLFWPAHVSDLGGWSNAAAVKYNVNAIPTNVLINGEGIIIGKALRGEDLLNTLSKYSN